MGGEIQGEERARDWDWRLRGRYLKGQPGQGRGFEDRLLGGGSWGGFTVASPLQAHPWTHLAAVRPGVLGAPVGRRGVATRGWAGLVSAFPRRRWAFGGCGCECGWDVGLRLAEAGSGSGLDCSRHGLFSGYGPALALSAVLGTSAVARTAL